MPSDVSLGPTEAPGQLGSMSLSSLRVVRSSNSKLVHVDGQMRELRAKLEGLLVEFQNALTERARLLEDSESASCEVSEKDRELMNRVEGICSTSVRGRDSNGTDLNMLSQTMEREAANCFLSRTGPLGHSRHSSGCDPEAFASGSGNSGELSGYAETSIDGLGMGDGLMLDHMLEMGDGEFVMDDEIDGISSASFPEGQSPDHSTPRFFIHSGAYDPDIFLEEQQMQTFGSEIADSEGDEYEDPDDQGALGVGNPPFAPMETQMPRPTAQWEIGKDVNEIDPCTWLSNTTFGNNNPGLHEALERDIQSHVQFRTTHVALLEQANRANRLMNELRQTQLTLEDVQSQLDYTTERMIAYKRAVQSEKACQVAMTSQHKLALDEATSSKFIMFCRLQESETRVKELEKDLIAIKQGLAEDEGVLHCEDLEEDMVDSQQSLTRSTSMESCDSLDVPDLYIGQSGFSATSRSLQSAGCTGVAQEKSSADNHPLHSRLAQTMRELLDAQTRGDHLQLRVKELQSQNDILKEQNALAAADSTDLRKAQAELKRMHSRLQKLESEMERSEKTKTEQEKEMSRLKVQIRSVRRGDTHGKSPRWR